MIEFVQLSGALTAEDAAKAITSRIIGMRNLMLPPKLVGWRSASPGFEPVSYCLVMQDTMDSACSNARPPPRQCHPPSRPSYQSQVNPSDPEDGLTERKASAKKNNQKRTKRSGSILSNRVRFDTATHSCNDFGIRSIKNRLTLLGFNFSGWMGERASRS